MRNTSYSANFPEGGGAYLVPAGFFTLWDYPANLLLL